MQFNNNNKRWSPRSLIFLVYIWSELWAEHSSVTGNQKDSLPLSDSADSDLGTGDLRDPVTALLSPFSLLLDSLMASRSLDGSAGSPLPALALSSLLLFSSGFAFSLSALGVFSLPSRAARSSFPALSSLVFSRRFSAFVSGVLPGVFSFFSFFSFPLFSLSSRSLTALVLQRHEFNQKCFIKDAAYSHTALDSLWADLKMPTCWEHHSHCWWSLWLLHCWLCSLALWSPEIYLCPDLHKNKPKIWARD